MTFIKQVIAAKLDGFDYCFAIFYGASASYWFFDGSALGALTIQVGGLLAMKTLMVIVDRYQAQKTAR